MSVECGSMNSSTTTLPRRPDSGTVRPSWSVSVNPGAGRAGTGARPIRLMVRSGTLAGMPEGRWPARESRWCQRTAMTPAADAAMSRTAAAAATVRDRRQPRHLRLDLGDAAAQQALGGLARARPGVADRQQLADLGQP